MMGKLGEEKAKAERKGGKAKRRDGEGWREGRLKGGKAEGRRRLKGGEG